MKELLRKIFQHYEIVIILSLVIGAIAVHSFNLFGYPAYTEDEGTYLSQAWSLLTQGRIAPYTYWYDHTPFGWILMSLWSFLTGGFFTFGLSVNSGRVLMVVLNALSTYFVYRITKNLTGRTEAGIAAALIFAFSPLSITFQRRVFLDNIMILWLLISLFFLTKPFKLRNIIISSITFGLAILSKETAFLFLPFFAVLVYKLAHQFNRSFATANWLFIAIFLVSLYPLLAILKGEFFPSDSLVGADGPHVSILQTIGFQMSRSGGFFLSPDSTFMSAFKNSWLRADSFYIILGIITTLINLIFFRNIWTIFLGSSTLLYILFLIRGGVVLDLYIIPLLPLFALNIGLFVAQIGEFLKQRFKLKYLSLLLSFFIGLAIYYQLKNSNYLFTANQTVNEIAAVEWAKNNIDPQSLLLIDNYAYVDLNDPLINTSDKLFGAQYYVKIDNDPEIKQQVIKNDWRSIDYLLVTPAFIKTMNDENLELVKLAYDNSFVVKTFDQYDGKSDPYPVEIRQVDNRKIQPLEKSWAYYKNSFLNSEGRTVDPRSKDTTSEGQSYTMLRAVWSNDQKTFDQTLEWTLNNLKISDKYLFSWLYGDVDGEIRIKDIATASDADEDIALALLFAYKKWGDERYLNLSQNIINDIWEDEVVEIQGKYYLTAGTNSKRAEGYIINPSYFSPATYRIFAQVDQNHPWKKLAEDSYTVLNQFHEENTLNSKSTKLLPNWFLVRENTGEFISAQKYIGEDSDKYGFDSFRIYWRVALDASWFNNPQAKKYLETAQPFYKEEWEKQKSYAALYHLDGRRATDYSQISSTTGPLSILLFVNQDLAKDVYHKTFAVQFNRQGFWGEKDNYYDQNWAWFAVALYTNNLPNLWS